MFKSENYKIRAKTLKADEAVSGLIRRGGMKSLQPNFVICSLKRVFQRFLISLLLILFFSASAYPVYASSLSLADTTGAKAAVSDGGSKARNAHSFLSGIKTQLKNSQEELTLLKNNKQVLETKVAESKVHVENLQSQLDNLSRLIAQNEEKIQVTKLQIAQYENAVAVLRDAIQQKGKDVGRQAESLDRALSAYYQHTNDFFSGDADTPKLLALLASDESTGEIVRENDNLFFLQTATQQLAQEIMQQQDALDAKQTELKEKTGKLGQLKDILDSGERTLLLARESRKRLLDETQGKQRLYQELLDASEKEEEQVGTQILRLQENFQFFQGKLDELGSSTITAGTFQPDTPEEFGFAGNAPLAWSVSPSMGISAFFHDSAYKKALGVQHNAIDIRVSQGTPVRSAGDGVVTKVVDNGLAYSYVIIAHPDKFLTLYGHLSEITVNEGEVVRQGETIGLSGGIPGSKGAGWLTTGAHLHFEVFKNWQHVNPLDYLPLELVPVASLPDEYLKKLTGQEKDKVRRN